MGQIIIKVNCIGCGACVVECNVEARDLVDGVAVVDLAKCNECGKCIITCPTNAISKSNQIAIPKEDLDPEAGSKFSIKEPLPESVQDYAQGNEKKTIRAQETTVGGGDVWSGVWVIIEYSQGKVAPVSWELLGEGRKLANALGCRLCGVITGHQVDSVISEAFAYGAEKVYVVDHPVLQDYRTEPYAEAITSLVRKYQPEIILMGATSMGRDVFPAVATRLETGLTADCTVLGIDPEKKLLLQTRPAFGGNIMATIMCRTRRPQMSTVRPRVMAMPERVERREGEQIREELNLNESNFRTKVLEFISTDAKNAFLDKAEIIVSIGLGIGAKKNIALAEELAEVLGATLAGSRGVVEAGWLTHDQQVGQSGVTVRPKIYIALGISGAIQHLVGMETSDFIIAINNDPEASIFKVANYGIIGDLFQIVPAMTAEFKKRFQYGLAN
jgi:electron transfer flavoprotein alpha subunit